MDNMDKFNEACLDIESNSTELLDQIKQEVNPEQQAQLVLTVFNNSFNLGSLFNFPHKTADQIKKYFNSYLFFATYANNQFAEVLDEDLDLNVLEVKTNAYKSKVLQLAKQMRKYATVNFHSYCINKSKDATVLFAEFHKFNKFLKLEETDQELLDIFAEASSILMIDLCRKYLNSLGGKQHNPKYYEFNRLQFMTACQYSLYRPNGYTESTKLNYNLCKKLAGGSFDIYIDEQPLEQSYESAENALQNYMSCGVHSFGYLKSYSIAAPLHNVYHSIVNKQIETISDEDSTLCIQASMHKVEKSLRALNYPEPVSGRHSALSNEIKDIVNLNELIKEGSF